MITKAITCNIGKSFPILIWHQITLCLFLRFMCTLMNDMTAAIWHNNVYRYIWWLAVVSFGTDEPQPLSALQLRATHTYGCPVRAQKPDVSPLGSCPLALSVSLTTLMPDVVGIPHFGMAAVPADGIKRENCDTQTISVLTKSF